MERKIYFGVQGMSDEAGIRAIAAGVILMNPVAGRHVEKLSSGVFPGKKTQYVGWICYVTNAQKEAILMHIRQHNWSPVEL